MAVICDKCKADIISPDQELKSLSGEPDEKFILKVNGSTFCLCLDCWMDVSSEISDIITENRELDNEAVRERKEVRESWNK